MYNANMANNIDEMTEELLRNQYPLHHGCLVGDESRVRELLCNGCFDIYQEDGCRAWTPMHWAAFSGNWKCLAVLREKYGPGFMDIPNKRFNQTPTHIAAEASQGDSITWLVQQGATLGSQDYLGETPLHKAARLGNLNCVKLLTSHGPALSVFNQNGLTPLDVAAQNGKLECKAFLEQALSSQHSSFFPSSSSPILMNGEGIYQRQKLPSLSSVTAEPGTDQDMDMGEEMGGGGGDAPPSSTFLCGSGTKRSMDEDDEPTQKRQRLFAPLSMDKAGTATNNNVLSSYNAVLAMSAEPVKMPVNPNTMCMEQVHGGDEWCRGAPPLCRPSPVPPAVVDLNSTSFQDHCHALQAQYGYDSSMVQSLIESDHGC